MLSRVFKTGQITISGSALALAMLYASPAAAQSEEEVAAAPVAAETAEEEEGIVVTGSRIRRDEFNSPDPIQIINPEIGARQGQNQVAELLQSSPIAQGSIQITSSISNNFVTNGGADAQTISLRGLGAERTLVLLNGRRAGPAGVRGAIASFDLNVLPISITRQIEILKTGASSIYGSDAVAGVVNILTKQNFDGFEIGGFSSVPTNGGGETYNLNGTFGKRFDRGHILATVDYFNQNNLRRNQRDFLGCQEEFLTREDGFTRADIVDFRTGKPACNGVIGNLILTNNDFTGFFGPRRLVAPNGQQLFIGQYGSEFAAVGVPFDPIPDITAPSNFYGLNFDGPSTGAINQYLPLEQFSDVFSQVERYTGYVDAAFELTDNIEVFTELLYNKRKSYSNGFQQLSTFQYTGNSDLPSIFCAPSDFNCDPGDAGDPFNNEFGGNFLLRPLVLTKSDFSTNIDYYRGVVGARGDFGGALSGWNWDVYGQYSRSDAKYTQDVIYADSLFTQDFRTRSCAGLVTPVRGVPCLDIDWTDPRVLQGNFTDAERAFLFGKETGNTIYEQKSAEATLSGNLFSLPAGKVGVALGAQIRRDNIKDTPGETTLAGNAALRTSSGITQGNTVSKEVFGEIEIPLIYNTPLIQRFTISAAGRHTSVNATRRDGAKDSFSDNTWKVGADWEVTDWLRFRGTWGTSFRAPALFELFLEDQTGFLDQQDIDICINTATRLAQGAITQTIFDNCTAAGIPGNFQGATGSATITSGGGIGVLDPETSTAKTASIILTPDLTGVLWSGLRTSLVVDYFDIEVRDQITTLGGTNIVIGCYDSQFFPDEPLCDLITRAPAGATDALNIRAVQDSYVNVNRQKNRGFDVTAQFEQDLGDMGTLSFSAQMTWQTKDTVALFDNTVIDDNGEAGEPKWVGDFNLAWEKGDWTLFYGLDVTGGTSDLEDLQRTLGNDANGNPRTCRTSIFRPGPQFCPDVRLSPTFYHSTSVTYRMNEEFQITLGMANILDTKPPRASTVFSGISAIGQAPAFGSQYDYFGRRLFLNVRGRF
jgi:iron complex outermembrane receptor protein